MPESRLKSRRGGCSLDAVFFQRHADVRERRFVPHNVSYVQTGVQWVLNLLYLNGTWTWLVVYYFLGGVFMFFLMRGGIFRAPQR